jgi:hypothetical protein
MYYEVTWIMEQLIGKISMRNFSVYGPDIVYIIAKSANDIAFIKQV